MMEKPPKQRPAHYIGLMSGTSMDAIDAVVVNYSKPIPKLIASLSYPIPDSARNSLARLNQQGDNELHQSATLDMQLADIFSAAAKQVLKIAKLNAENVDAIGSHGQTIRHNMETAPFYTTQIGNPHNIAFQTGIKTVADFRRKDIAAGGQGAPLAPAFHKAMMQDKNTDRVILNLGGIANITNLWKDQNKPTTGFDTGPASLLMDAWINLHKGLPYDDAGLWAMSGTYNKDLLDLLLAEKYLSLQPPKSTGRDLYNLDYLQDLIETNQIKDSAENIQATLAEFTAESISSAILKWGPQQGELFVCGGGVHNKHLLGLLADKLPGFSIDNTSKLGVDPDWLEAMAFAWLAKQFLENKTGNLPEVTGAKQAVILGSLCLPD